jgi:2'-hydroxyisoflavone reductase
MKKILILGGTQFIGRNLVEQLQVTRNYEITLFNRQQTNSNLFPDIKKIKGDRETDDIKQLSGVYWDYVIDLSCYYPDSLHTLLNTLKGQTGRYIFMSTLSAYLLDDEMLKTLIREDAATLTHHQQATYGQRKAACEAILLSATWLDKIILRPSIIYGKYDHTDRFYYWLYRSRNNQPFILPDNKTDKITLTYIGDLVNIIIQSLEIKEHQTIYNASTHPPLSLKGMILYMNSDAALVEIDGDKLIADGIRPEEDIPLWFNSPLMLNNERLIQDFKPAFKSFKESIDETVAYFSELNWPKPKTGLDLKREAELLG